MRKVSARNKPAPSVSFKYNIPLVRETRAQLHQLVWTNPVRILCKEFEISNVWLAKVCARHEIPVPGRGYWARSRSGATVPIPKLKAASGGVPNSLEIRGGTLAQRRMQSNSVASAAHLVDRRSGAPKVDAGKV